MNKRYMGGNVLLDRLPPVELASLRPYLEVVDLTAGQLLYPGGAQRDLDFVLFPIDAVASMVATLADGSTVEAGTAGREGVVGAQCVLASARMFERWIAQVPGAAARIRLTELRDLVGTSAPIRATLQCYLQSYIAFLAQSIACNTRHSVTERCARWLLLTQDRVGRDEFHLTQEFLATMLGVRRPSVSAAAATLANAGFISYTRGTMKIRNRRGLESAACECYALTTGEFERMFPSALDSG